MCTQSMTHKWWCILIFIIGLFAFTACAAGRGGEGGGNYGHSDNFNNGNNYNNNDHNDSVNRGTWDDSAVVVGVPNTGYLSPNTCTIVQQCDSDGNCVQNSGC